MDQESLDRGTTGVTLERRGEERRGQVKWNDIIYCCIFSRVIPLFTNLLADAAPGVVEDGVLIPRHRGVQLLQHYLHATAAVHEAPDVVHHGSFTEHAGTLVRRSWK